MQCGGHSPPYALKWIVFFGCQSRVAEIGRPALANLSILAFRPGTTASPPATASAPPGQKSFCTSTITSASLPCIDSDYMEDNLVARKGARRQRSPLSISHAHPNRIFRCRGNAHAARAAGRRELCARRRELRQERSGGGSIGALSRVLRQRAAARVSSGRKQRSSRARARLVEGARRPRVRALRTLRSVRRIFRGFVRLLLAGGLVAIISRDGRDAGGAEEPWSEARRDLEFRLASIRHP